MPLSKAKLGSQINKQLDILEQITQGALFIAIFLLAFKVISRSR